MNACRTGIRTALLIAVAIPFGGLAQTPSQAPPSTAATDLGGTSWQIVKFEGGDGKTLTSDAPSKYTIAFDRNGSVSVRIDCNRGHGTWKSSGGRRLDFSPMALTRAMCPPAKLSDRLPQDWSSVQSYRLKDGHLFLSLKDKAGVYEFAPADQPNH